MGCFRETEPRRYLKRQVDLHDPRVLIFSAGLSSYYGENNRANARPDLMRLWPPHILEVCEGIWTGGSGQRLSIGLGSNKVLKQFKTEDLTAALQLVIDRWYRDSMTATPTHT